MDRRERAFLRGALSLTAGIGLALSTPVIAHAPDKPPEEPTPPATLHQPSDAKPDVHPHIILPGYREYESVEPGKGEVPLVPKIIPGNIRS